MRDALLLSTVLLLAGCGGGDPKQEYIEEASEICERASSERDDLTFPAKPADFAPYADEVVAIAERAQEDLAELEPPEEDRAELERRVLEPYASLVQEGKAFAEEVRAAGEDQKKLLPLLGQVPDADEVDLEYLRSYGLGTCADAISR